MSSIQTFLFFSGEQAQDAVNFYLSLVPGSKIVETHRVGDAGPGRKDSVNTIGFIMDGKSYVGQTWLAVGL